MGNEKSFHIRAVFAQMKKYPKYENCPEVVKKVIARTFADIMQRCPFPSELDKQIAWIRNVAVAIRSIEVEKMVFYEIAKDKQLI